MRTYEKTFKVNAQMEFLYLWFNTIIYFNGAMLCYRYKI